MSSIVVAGWVAQFPTAPFFWHAMSFALGFRALGHDVWFLNDSGDEPWGWDVENARLDVELAAGVRFLEREAARVGMDGRWVVRHVPGDRHSGMTAEETADVLHEAEVFVNVSLVTPMRPEYRQIPHRLAVDTDPVFTQIRIAQVDTELAHVPSDHTRLFTFGRPPLPGARHEWLPTRQPVVLDRWTARDPAPRDAPLTSVLAWQSYAAVVWEGEEYAAKDQSFLPYLDLPRETSRPVELALGGQGSTPQVHALLRSHGWRTREAGPVTVSTEAYADYLASSGGEFGIAKDGYVRARCGWFSERTCAYLATGRPAVVQDTGWSDWLPSGEGLLGFTTLKEAVDAVEAVGEDPQRHSRAARRVVEQHFAAEDVCRELLEVL